MKHTVRECMKHAAAHDAAVSYEELVKIGQWSRGFKIGVSIQWGHRLLKFCFYVNQRLTLRSLCTSQ